MPILPVKLTQEKDLISTITYGLLSLSEIIADLNLIFHISYS